MALDLAFGRKIYNWWGSHPSLYALGSQLVFLGRETAIRRRAIEAVGLDRGHRVMDLACGNGVNFEILQERVGRDGRIVGFDYSRGMLAAARARVAARKWKNVRLLQGDAARLNLLPGALDGAFCSLGLSAVPDYRAAVENVHRALKPGGRFVVLDAALFEGPARVLNPLITPAFKYTTNWNPAKDIPALLTELFLVRIETFNSGSIYVAVAEKI